MTKLWQCFCASCTRRRELINNTRRRELINNTKEVSMSFSNLVAQEEYEKAKPGSIIPVTNEQVIHLGGLKYDGGKLRMGLLINGLALPLKAVAAVLSYGAQKYKADSWQTVPDAKSRYEDAYYRHQNARAAGEIYDEESGLPHRAHEICNALFLLWFDIKDGTVKNIDKYNQYK